MAPDTLRMAHRYQPDRTGPVPGRVVLPCTAVGTPLALYALALVVRLVLLAGFPDPAYPDSFYYVDVAHSLAAGHGFSIDVVWIFPEVGGTIPANPTLPVPSNAHWMPLASIVQVPFIWLLGPTALASALPFAFLGSIAAPLTWAIARDAGASRLVATGAGVLIAIPAASAVFMAQPDNFGLYQPLVAGALWMGARGLRGDARGFALGGLLVGLATLARNDGVLVGAALGLAVRLGPLARVAQRRVPAPGDPAVGRRRLLRPLPGRRRALVRPPAGRLRLHLAVVRVGQGVLHPLHRRVEQHHDAGQPGVAPGAGRWGPWSRAGSAAWSPPSRSSRSWWAA